MNRALKIFAVNALLLGGAAFASAAAPARTNPAAAAAWVRIANFTFNSPTITIRPGTTVTWANEDDIPHTVVSKDKIFKSKVLDSGEHFSITFAKTGQFVYFCSLHPHMTGTVIVRAGRE